MRQRKDLKVDMSLFRKVDVRCTVYGFGPSYYVGHLPGLMQSQILRSKPRGYTISQLPLHRGLQYMSLRTNHCDAYPIGTLPDLTGNQKLNAGAVSASGHHRYAKSSTMDTKLLNSLDDSSNMTKLGYGVKQARTADTTANRKTAFEGLNSKSHEQVVGVRNDRKDFETAAIAENGYSLIQSNESSSHSGSKPGAGNGTEWHAGKMTDVTSCNSGMVTKLNVGDEVKIKDEKDILIELPTWILDHVIISFLINYQLKDSFINFCYTTNNFLSLRIFWIKMRMKLLKGQISYF